MNCTRRQRFVALRLLSIILLLLPVSAGAVNDDESVRENSSAYELVIEHDLISLSCKEISVNRILKDIGKRMDIRIVTEIPDAEKVTVDFSKLSLEKVLERLSGNYVFITNSEKQDGKINKIVLLREGKGPGPSTAGNKASSNLSLSSPGKGTDKEDPGPESFKLQIDPSKYLKEDEK